MPIKAPLPLYILKVEDIRKHYSLHTSTQMPHTSGLHIIGSFGKATMTENDSMIIYYQHAAALGQIRSCPQPNKNV